MAHSEVLVRLGRSAALVLLVLAAGLPTRASAAFVAGPGLIGTPFTGGARQGQSVAISGDGATVLSGAPFDGRVEASGSFTGTTWLFARANGSAQQSGELPAAGTVGGGRAGWSVAISADGNTALAGAPEDQGRGLVWTYARSGATWDLEGTTTKGFPLFGGTDGSRTGFSVALSADGNTALVGAPGDAGNTGGAFVFVRSNGSWSQQGGELRAGSGDASAEQGYAVALSGDGDTALVGAPGQAGGSGRAWLFTRSGDTWSEGPELAGAGASGAARFGSAVALAQDGSTALVGAPGDGAAFAFTRTGATWTQDGGPLSGGSSPASAREGVGVALSADGATALLGAPDENGGTGAGWVFVRGLSGWAQQGPALVGASVTGAAGQGTGVALSASGDVAVLGGPSNAGVGAVWTFSRSGGTWSAESGPLAGAHAGGSAQGSSVAIAANGSTVLVGGPHDSSDIGAAWPFTGAGVQDGPKLVGSGSLGDANRWNPRAQEGASVALSGDGSKALVGGPQDGGFSSDGAVWTFTRSGAWSQVGAKLTPPDGAQAFSTFGAAVALSGDGSTALVGAPAYAGSAWAYRRAGLGWVLDGALVPPGGDTGAGSSVALSADGRTALVGAPGLNRGAGGALVFVHGPGGWSQQGPALIGTGASRFASQGTSVALSADGSTALVGASRDTGEGAAWVFRRLGPTWYQEGSKLVGAGATSPAAQGTSVALSADGATALIGGPQDGDGAGAAWVFARSGSVWTQRGDKLTANAYSGLGSAVALSGNGNTAVLGAPESNSARMFTNTTPWSRRDLRIATQGSGKVTSAPAGIVCGLLCSATFDRGSRVSLSASPAPGWKFVRWSEGGCTAGRVCAVSLDQDASVTAVFQPLPVSLFASRVRARRAHITLSLACFGIAGQRCRGVIRLNAVPRPRKNRAILLATRRLLISAGRAPRVRLDLNAAGRHLLARVRHLRAELTVVLAGHHRKLVLRRRVTLRA